MLQIRKFPIVMIIFVLAVAPALQVLAFDQEGPAPVGRAMDKAPVSDWRFNGHDSGNTFYSEAVPARSGDILWQLDMSDHETSNPVIVGQRVFFAVYSSPVQIYCVDLTTGDVLWSKTLGNYSISTEYDPYADQERVYLQYDLEGHFGVAGVWALYQSNGTLAWEISFDTSDILFATLVEDSIVVNNQTFTRLYNSSTGHLDGQYKNAYHGPDTGQQVSSCGQDLYINVDKQNSTGPMELISTNITTQQTLWNVPNNAVYEVPVCTKDRVYFSTNGIFYALNRDSGKTVWTSNLLAQQQRTIAVSDRYIAYAATFVGVQVFNITNGNAIWAQNFVQGDDYEQQLALTPATIVQDVLFVGYSAWSSIFDPAPHLGFLKALNLSTGKVLWSTQFNFTKIGGSSLSWMGTIAASDNVVVFRVGPHVYAIGDRYSPTKNHAPSVKMSTPPDWPPLEVKGEFNISAVGTDLDPADGIVHAEVTVSNSTGKKWWTSQDFEPVRHSQNINVTLNSTLFPDSRTMTDHYTVSVKVTDRGFATDMCWGNFTVNNTGLLNYTHPKNQPPVLELPGPLTVYVGDKLVLELNATDPENDPLVFTIDPREYGTKTTGPTLIWNATGPGIYHFEVSVSDGINRVDGSFSVQVDNITFTVDHPALYEAVGGTMTINGTCPLDWSAPEIWIDDGSHIVSNWTTDNHWTALWDTTEHPNGIHEITVRRDCRYCTVRQLVVPVNVTNSVPVLAAGLDLKMIEDKNVQFKAPQYKYLDPSTTVYTWDFGDGGLAQGPSTNHTYDRPGHYLVGLTLENNGSSYKIVNEIDVGPSGNGPPVTYIGNWALPLLIVTMMVLLVGLTVLGSTEVGIYGLMPFFLVLYSRITRNEVLDHYTRGRIMGYLQANPGDTLNGIKAELELKNGTLAYHLKVLEREGYVRSQRIGLHKRFYPVGSRTKRPVGLEEQVLATLRRNPGINQKEVSRWVGDDPVRTHRVIHRLAKAGVIRLRRDGREMRCFLEEEGQGMDV